MITYQNLQLCILWLRFFWNAAFHSQQLIKLNYFGVKKYVFELKIFHYPMFIHFVSITSYLQLDVFFVEIILKRFFQLQHFIQKSKIFLREKICFWTQNISLSYVHHFVSITSYSISIKFPKSYLKMHNIDIVSTRSVPRYD